MDAKKPSGTPRIIVHGGAGNISRSNLPPERQKEYRKALLYILSASNKLLQEGQTALDVATHAVTLFEDNPLFNCARGAVFTRAGTIELEASIMVSRGYRKRGVGCMLLKRVMHPIKLAREMLIRGDEWDGKGGGAYGHVQLSGEELEGLAETWGLQLVHPMWFWTRRRWEEHKRGLEREEEPHTSQQDCGTAGFASAHEPVFEEGDPSWDGHEYLPQGTVGAVVLDRYGTLCVATSTGGLTNKLPGRIGDTPTLGAGFWAEEWPESMSPLLVPNTVLPRPLPQPGLLSILGASINDCLHLVKNVVDWDGSWPTQSASAPPQADPKSRQIRAVAMSGTGNGDSFLRLSAARTTGAMVRFTGPALSLAAAVRRMAGPGGELQLSAGDRWGSGEGEGGIIGIELINGEGTIAWDFNCGGLFRAWIDDGGAARCLIFRDE